MKSVLIELNGSGKPTSTGSQLRINDAADTTEVPGV